MLSKAGWTPYDGMVVQGVPVATYVRGKLVASEGQIVADPGIGQFLPGPGTMYFGGAFSRGARL